MLKKKTFFALIAFLAFVLMAALCPAVFFSVNAEEEDMVAKVTTGFLYEDPENKTVVNGFTLPEEVEGMFEVVLPESVTTVKANSFVGTGAENMAIANNLVAVEFPAGIRTIEANAFVDCNNLLEVCIPEELANGIADTGLAGALNIITNKNDKTLRSVSDGSGRYLFVWDDGEQKSWQLISYQGTAETLTLPEPTLFSVGCNRYQVYRHAFSNHAALTSVVVPSYVQSLGDRAFSGCSKLSSIALNEGLTYIGKAAFTGTALSAVAFPKTLTQIDEQAFYGCAGLLSVTFENGEKKLSIENNAFNGCAGLRVVRLPEACDVGAYAFSGCTGLAWVYAGENTTFRNNAGEEDASAVFFPTNTNLNVVFPSKAAYDKMLAQTDKTFSVKHGGIATYVINVNCYIGASAEPTVYKRLHGENFNYVCDEETGIWNTDTAYSVLPVQAAHYASTVWYSERELTNKIGWERVNSMLSSESEINLYCYETVFEPTLPTEPKSWVFDADVSYDIGDLSAVLVAMGCDQTFTEAQLNAMKMEIVYADSDGKVAATPAAISQNGVYSITVTLDPDYGSWSKPTASTVTVNVDTSGFNVVLIVFLVIGGLAVVVTVSTAIIRKKVQARAKKKQLSSQEVLEKFRAAGGETTLK